MQYPAQPRAPSATGADPAGPGTLTDTLIGTGTWPALAAARRADPSGRVPFGVMDGGAAVPVGSVARANLEVLREWPGWLRLTPAGVLLTVAPAERDACLAEIHQALRARGAIQAWRDELYRLPGALPGQPLRCLAVIERAAARFWGSLTLGAHCNGYVADAQGRPTYLWVARRADTKATDPGLLDNLIGGGVPLGQTPREALLREAWEEAGLRPAQMAGLRRGHVIGLHCDLPEGLQREWLYVYDLPMPADLLPANQDGEVAEHRLWPVDQALAFAARGEMTVDAALATLDFALRHDLLAGVGGGGAAPAASMLAALAARAAALRVDEAEAAQFEPAPGDRTDRPHRLQSN
jgi:8-oxo-dGTP pyrophosphatase MutT (NUDIX family)